LILALAKETHIEATTIAGTMEMFRFGIPILCTNGECPLADRWSGNKSAS
jgi:hypothetical protein